MHIGWYVLAAWLAFNAGIGLGALTYPSGNGGEV